MAWDFAEVFDSKLVSGSVQTVFREESPQIYSFDFFTPEFCRYLVDTLESDDEWLLESVLQEFSPLNTPKGEARVPSVFRLHADYLEKYFGVSTQDTGNHAKNVKPLSIISGVNDFYRTVVEKHLENFLKELWSGFELYVVSQPYAIRYDMQSQTEMKLHYDAETIAMIVYLNDDYEGGGTFFPQWNYHTGKLSPGKAIVYPGWVSHVHQGCPITSGRRYLAHGAFF